jgi:signal transduction histidine kinase
MTDSRTSRQWYWMPATVLLIGTLSIALLIWVDRMGVRLNNDHVTVGAVMDMQIHTATGHLWLEEVIHGNPQADAEDVINDFDRAIDLVDVGLEGGESEHGRILGPLRDPDIRARVAALKPMLESLRTIGLARMREPEKSGIDSDINQVFDSLFLDILGNARDVEDLIKKQQVRNQETSGRLFIGVTATWAFIVAIGTVGLWRRGRLWNLAEKERQRANEQLLSQATELTEHREHLADLVAKRTAELRTANELLRSEIAERERTAETLKKTGEKIQHLCSQVVGAQEIERRRISMALHDELGQALSLIKLEIRGIENRLEKDRQGVVRADCEKLLRYVDHVIEDVRKLSLNLSPTILEDLGLTSALQWLVNNFVKTSGLNITVDMAEVESELAENEKIVVYRVIQEALTNVVRHAQARNVSLAAGRQDDSIVFSVEDDGKGFDTEQVVMKGATERGLGLRTMDERVTMMGGVFDLWSRKEEGTRITFSIPIANGVL